MLLLLAKVWRWTHFWRRRRKRFKKEDKLHLVVFICVPLLISFLCEVNFVTPVESSTLRIRSDFNQQATSEEQYDRSVGSSSTSASGEYDSSDLEENTHPREAKTPKGYQRYEQTGAYPNDMRSSQSYYPYGYPGYYNPSVKNNLFTSTRTSDGAIIRPRGTLHVNRLKKQKQRRKPAKASQDDVQDDVEENGGSDESGDDDALQDDFKKWKKSKKKGKKGKKGKGKGKGGKKGLKGASAVISQFHWQTANPSLFINGDYGDGVYEKMTSIKDYFYKKVGSILYIPPEVSDVPLIITDQPHEIKPKEERENVVQGVSVPNFVVPLKGGWDSSSEESKECKGKKKFKKKKKKKKKKKWREGRKKKFKKKKKKKKKKKDSCEDSSSGSRSDEEEEEEDDVADEEENGGGGGEVDDKGVVTKGDLKRIVQVLLEAKKRKKEEAEKAKATEAAASSPSPKSDAYQDDKLAYLQYKMPTGFSSQISQVNNEGDGVKEDDEAEENWGVDQEEE